MHVTLDGNTWPATNQLPLGLKNFQSSEVNLTINCGTNTTSTKCFNPDITTANHAA